MAEQCGLCLSCGTPFLPIAEDMVNYDSLGNISLLYLNRRVRNDPVLQRRIRHPSITAKGDSSHVVHASHHEPAVRVMSLYCEQDFSGMPRMDFPFVRAPRGANPTPLIAQWKVVRKVRDMVNMTQLADYLAGLAGVVAPPFDLQTLCCRDCNSTMTMEFWFRYHLFGRDNPHKIIRDRSVRVYRADTQGLPPTDIPSRAYGAWLPVNPALGRYPPVNNVRTEDIMSPAVARFLYLCWPNNAHALRAGVDGLKLFTHLAWVAMEVTCLLCEYWRGSRDAEQHESRELKRNQCEKSAIGAAELYFSYFCWRAFGASKNLIRSMSFVQWHQVYMWGATHCEALFPDAGALLMDRLTPDDMHAPSKQLVENVCARMTDIMRARIEPLANYLCGTPTPALHAYFLPRKNLLAFLILARRGLVTDFDSFAGQIGIDCMLFRLMDTTRDMPNEIRSLLRSLRAAWRKAEIQNVSRETRAPPAAAEMLYRLCRLLTPPTDAAWRAMSDAEADAALTGPTCSPFASALALNRLGAFDSKTV